MIDNNTQKKPIQRIDKISGEIKNYESMQEAKRDGFHQGAISACCNGKVKSHKGFTWRFLS